MQSCHAAVQGANKRPATEMYRESINVNNNYAQYQDLEAHRNKYVKDNDTHKDPSGFFFCRIYSINALGRHRAMDTWSCRRGEWQWLQRAIIHHPGHEDMQTDYTEHEDHMKYPYNYGAVSMWTSNEESWAIDGYFKQTVPVDWPQQSAHTAHSRNKDTYELWEENEQRMGRKG